MHVLIVVAHYDRQSLTQGIAKQLAKGIESAGSGHRAEIVDLYAEGFNPVFTAADHAVHRKDGMIPSDVAAEHARINRADALVLVYPVYWWSMPALMKGWIDRVFVNGWAFDFSPKGGLEKKLGHLNVHLVGVGGADADTYARHGYSDAMKAQIDHGIFDYCGAPVRQSVLLLDSETQDPGEHLEAARALGRKVLTLSARV